MSHEIKKMIRRLTTWLVFLATQCTEFTALCETNEIKENINRSGKSI